MLALLLALTGCNEPAEAPVLTPRVMNTPANRAEAALLMHSIDVEAVSNRWNEAATRHLRSRMTSRLLAAGMKHEDIENWIASPLATNDPTEITDEETDEEADE